MMEQIEQSLMYLKKAHNDGYTNVRIVAGQDRVKEFDKLSQNYNGQLISI